MSHILAAWINNEVGLSKPVQGECLDTSFRSGYLFGELLSKLQIHGQSMTFVNSESVDALIKNYSLLEETLHSRLNIKLSSTYALDIINGKRGAATKLLYQIKSALDELKLYNTTLKFDNHVTLACPKPLKNATHNKTYSYQHRELPNGDLISYPSSPAEQVNPLVPPIRNAKHVYHQKEVKFFSEMLKAKLKRYQFVQEDKPKFFDAVNQTLHTKKMNANLALAIKHKTTKNYNTAVKKTCKILNSDDIMSATRVHELDSSENLKSVTNLECTDLDFKPKLESPDENYSLAAKVNNEILKFEQKMGIYNLSEEAIETDSIFSKESRKSICTLSSSFNIDTIKATENSENQFGQKIILKPIVAENQEKTKQYLAKIRNQRLEEEYSRKDREQRRRKIILNQQQAEQEMEKLNMENLVVSKLLRQSKQERRIAEQLMQIRHEKEIMHDNRVFRETQYASQRQKDYEDALTREFELSEQARIEYKEKMSQQMLQHFEILEAKRAVKHQKNLVYCHDIVNELINIAFEISDYCILNDSKQVSQRQMREWKTMFICYESVSKPSVVEIEQEMKLVENTSVTAYFEGTLTEKPSTLNSDPKTTVLDDAELSDYLNSFGIWQLSAQNPVTNFLLGQLVENIMTLSAVPEAVYETVPIPCVPLRVAIIGKPFSGKITLARSLAEMYNMTLLRVDDLMKEAISVGDPAPKKLTTDAKDKNLKKKLSKQQIGAKIQLEMLEGHGPNDSMLVSLIIEALGQKPINPGGWILVGFPQTRAQAQLLEHELSGYEDPKPIKKGDLKRSKDKDKSASKNRSIIAPVDVQCGSTTVSPVSGLDCVLLLDVKNEISVSRCAGQRFDPVSGETCHIELNPPQILPGTFDRLALLDDESRAKTQLQYQLVAFENEEEQLKNWFSRFDNLKLVEAGEDVQSTFNQAVAVINQTISLKQSTKSDEDAIYKENDGCNPSTFYKSSDAVQEINEDDKKTDNAKNTFEGNHVNAGIATIPGNVQPEIQSGALQVKAATPNDTIEKQKSIGVCVQSGQSKDKAPYESVLSISGNSQMDALSHHIARKCTTNGKQVPSQDLAEILTDQWTTIEETYTDTLKLTFRSIRNEQNLIAQYFFDVKTSFQKFLQRPDSMQDLIDVAQAEYNAIEDDIRSDLDTKSELHQRIEDLRDRLWEISDKRRDDAEAERLSLIEDKWTEDHSIILANTYILIMQAEVDRYLGSCQLITDYYRDSNLKPLSDMNRLQSKIHFIPSSALAPIEIATILVTAHESHVAQKREGIQSASINEQVVPFQAKPTKSGNTVSSSQGQAKEKDVTKKPATGNSKTSASATATASIPAITIDQSIRHATPAQYMPLEKDPIVIDYENINFPDIQAAYEMCIGFLTQNDHGSDIPSAYIPAGERRDKKKPFEVGESKIDDAESQQSPELLKALELEEQVLRYRLERVRQKSIDHLKKFRQKSFESFILLDDWIGARFQAEMNAAKDMTNVFKEAIESEEKLLNQLTLSGEKFQVDFGKLTLEPELVMPPESPVEKSQPDQFTVLQLLHFGNQLRTLAPAGQISCKHFYDYLARAAALGSTNDFFPESYCNVDVQKFQQICYVLDPFETGYIDWRKFIILNARILPVNLSSFIDIKLDFDKLSHGTHQNQCSKYEFMQLYFWFENDFQKLEDSQLRHFDRPGKLKDALFELFSKRISSDLMSIPEALPLDSSFSLENNSTLEDQQYLDIREFLACCALDESPICGLQKAFYAFGTLDGLCTANDVYDLLHHFLNFSKSSHRLDEDSLEDPYPMSTIQHVFEEQKISKGGMISFESFIAGCQAVGLAILSCPLYLIEDITIYNARSRPSSGFDSSKGMK
ncbi:hypothetical protein MT418_8550 [Batrachochytrium dendrobatidis]